MKLVFFLFFVFWVYKYWCFTRKRSYYKKVLTVAIFRHKRAISEQSTLDLACAFMMTQRYADAYGVFKSVIETFPDSVNSDAIIKNLEFCKKPLPWSKELRNYNMGYWHDFMLVRFGGYRINLLSQETLTATDIYIENGDIL